ncbi:hypothetical protein J4573_09980 [Actinomadura barringtoniae]|uniref:Glycosyl hydrolase family 13 catalytic domain-containing protein n=1 Tax=Actinomadura barringtoniae TaxID=1427535 RepID=A0A939T3Y5_9ACTN|nr:alpha-amylase family glycosyl hydrolase [Actinomadura barringtoniae]MBO2447414.1 hypothetical protein [Actinomadura barringtoniae]
MSEPVIYEVNTLVWLTDVQRRHGGRIDLRNVPKEAWDELVVPGIDAVWLMGVWQRSPAGRGIALTNRELLDSFQDAVPGYSSEEIAGSPYCVRRYVADDRLGGPPGLAAARAELDRRGAGLFLDYVPNHVAPDHFWLTEHPEYFVHDGIEDEERDPAAYISIGGNVFARGRDPYFPPWPDVVQLNAFDSRVRTATAEILSGIGAQCDGVRCDMAMLMMNDVFARTWGKHVGPAPAGEFWPEVIGQVRERHPGMTFVAEAYWDLEWNLQEQGFDFCYDKRLYDRLVSGNPAAVRDHLRADVDYQRRLVRFLENHDEPRAAATFGPEQERAAAVAIATLPGATLWQEGELEGRRSRVPVFLSRRADEKPDGGLSDFHRRLMTAAHDSGMRDGEWQLLECHGWPDNPTHLGMVSWCWTGGPAHHLVVVNLLDRPAQARIPLPWTGLDGGSWRLRDVLSGASYDRDGDELRDPGLYVDMPAWGADVFAVESRGA